MALEQPRPVAQTESPLISPQSEPFSAMDSIPTPSSSTTSLIPPPSSPLIASSDISLPSASHFQRPSSTPADTNGIDQVLATMGISSNQFVEEVDPQILEALKNKDRIYVLKLGELMEGLISDRTRPRIDLTPATSYQRLLVHRCSAYYRLSPESDPVNKSISVTATLESRIPVRRLCELVPAEFIAQPAFKIMRRSLQDRRLNRSQSGSVTGEDADLSDVEPSEAGSLGGRSNATSGSNKKRMTIEQREAAYNEARSRIFMDFEEKEKEKEKGKELSGRSSSASLTSGSASASTSAGGGSSAGDLDEATSSPTTESEWSVPSGPNSRDKKDAQRMAGSGPPTSSRSLRPSAPPFNVNGQGSSRNSRASSPSFTYATIYEPPQGPAFDPSQHPSQPGYHHPSQYHYPYMHSAQPPNPYIPPYPYYPPYNPYQHSPPAQPQGVSDSISPSNGDMHSPPPHSGYGPPYGWPPYPHPPSLQSPPHMQQPLPQLPPQQPHANANHVAPPPPAHGPPYQQYMPQSQAYPYPMPGYYPQQHGQHVEPPAPHMAVQPMYDVPGPLNRNVIPPPIHSNSAPIMGRNDMSNSSDNSRNPNRNASTGGGGKARSAPLMPQPARSPWSFGPGLGANGRVPSTGGEAFGPRLSSRRQSGNSSATSRSSNNDDVASTASSSTSSSSQRTYTSTSTSSQHPLPPRPDWAVGLKPQPTLHSTQGRHHDHSHNNSRTISPISPPRTLNGGPPHSGGSRQPQSQQMPPIMLQSADFPPLISPASAQEKRTPIAGGAWGNSARSIHQPNLNNSTSPTNAVQHLNQSIASNNGSETRIEESDRTFERPPPKSVELYNPKLLRRPTGGKAHGEKEKERARCDAVAGAILVAQAGSMSLEDKSGESSLVAAPVGT